MIITGIPDTPEGLRFEVAWYRWWAAFIAQDPPVAASTIARLERELQKAYIAAKDEAGKVTRDIKEPTP